jgi:uncharacterized membrane protein YhaH (DUF805 family)
MAVAYDYPLLEVFWSLLEVFIFIAWIMVVFGMLTDVFRSDDLSGVAKAGWVILLILLPIFGVIIYLVARGDKVSEHANATIDRQDAAYMSYINRGR